MEKEWITWNGGAELVGIEGDETALELVAAHAGRSDEDDGSRCGRMRQQARHFLVGGDLLPVKVVVFCQRVHHFLSGGRSSAAGRTKRTYNTRRRATTYKPQHIQATTQNNG